MIFLRLFVLFFFSISATRLCAQNAAATSHLYLKFDHTSSSSHIVLRDSVYTTPLGDSFTLTKLKYYISNFLLDGKQEVNEEENYQLVDLARQTEFILPVPAGKYSTFGFTLGVDSARNCSGAQTGALDPMNDMFWTWNSGYVMFKLDGTSPSSAADRNRIEHHVGGYRLGQNVAKQLQFDLGERFSLKAGDTLLLAFNLNLDKYWNSVNKISLKENSVCTLPGALALKISENFIHMFSLTNAELNEK